MKTAVVYFPGNNCEEETKRAAETAGMPTDIVRWNDTSKLSSYDGYIIPGGWAYEDRIRAGVIASKDDVMDIIKKEAAKGKPVLGICNGAQVLVESGLVPGLKDEAEMALAPNINPFVSGYYCAWVTLKKSAKCAFTNFKEELVRMPIAHGEGRFTTSDKALLPKIKSQIAFQYCDEGGKVIDKFPVNPNGSVYNIAAVCNKKGNVMAVMPHPERAAWAYQIPGKEEPLGIRLFESMKKYIEARS